MLVVDPMLRMTLLALANLMAIQASLWRIVAQKKTVLSDPIISVREIDTPVTLVTKIGLNVARLADRQPLGLGSLAVLRRPGLRVREDHCLVALGTRRRLLVGFLWSLTEMTVKA